MKNPTTPLNLEIPSNRVLCRVILSPLKTPGGLFFPEQHTTTEGKVMKVGTECPLPLKENDRVVFERHAGTALEWEGEKYVLFNPDELLCVLEGA